MASGDEHDDDDDKEGSVCLGCYSCAEKQVFRHCEKCNRSNLQALFSGYTQDGHENSPLALRLCAECRKSEFEHMCRTILRCNNCKQSTDKVKFTKYWSKKAKNPTYEFKVYKCDECIKQIKKRYRKSPGNLAYKKAYNERNAERLKEYRREYKKRIRLHQI
jgi:hypothetical protein